MAPHARAAQALHFMQQCRQHARSQARPSHIRTVYDQPSLDPNSFGKRMRIQEDPDNPIPEWRRHKQESLPSTPSTLQSQIKTIRAEQPTSTTNTEPNPYDFPRSRDMPIPRHRHNPAIKPGLFSFIKYRILRLPEPPNPNLNAKPTFTALTNPYRARKTWPPIIAQMSELQQFHYEKKFRRRLLNKTRAMRFTWDTWALFFRRFIIGFVIVYFALISEPGNPDTRLPPDGLRYWIYGELRRGNGEELGGEGRQFWPRRFGTWIEDQYRYYRRKHKRQWDPYNHEGWDESRPRNSLPGQAIPAVNRPLEDPTS